MLDELFSIPTSTPSPVGEANTKSTRWAGRQAYHKIPVEVFNNSPLLQRLEKQGLFKLNGKGNGIMLRQEVCLYINQQQNKIGLVT